MADKKISQLTALSAANLAPSTDVLAIVDTSATETKKIVAQDLINGVLNVASAVGIGTASPAFKLDVNGVAAVRAGNAIRYYRTDNAIYTQLYDAGASGFTLDNVNGNGFRFQSAGTTQAVIDSSGNLGIGTTSPASTLEAYKSVDVASASNQDVLTLTTVDGAGGYYYAGLGSGIAFRSGKTSATVFNPAVMGAIYGANSSDESVANGYLSFHTRSSGTVAERGRFTAGGDLLVGTTSAVQFNTSTVTGWNVNNAGQMAMAASATITAYFNRLTDDGTIISLRQDGVEEGTISVSGNTVSYNAFAGSHWSQLQDGSKPDILRGTVMESINELCEWPGEENERLPKSKISDTAGSKKVYGVFMAWDNDWAGTNDMYVTAVGAFICRVNGSVTVQEGDLLESNGDGTARVQADDIIRSSTIGKVTSTVKTHEYDDGSYCVPTVLYCG